MWTLVFLLFHFFCQHFTGFFFTGTVTQKTDFMVKGFKVLKFMKIYRYSKANISHQVFVIIYLFFDKGYKKNEHSSTRKPWKSQIPVSIIPDWQNSPPPPTVVCCPNKLIFSPPQLWRSLTLLWTPNCLNMDATWSFHHVEDLYLIRTSNKLFLEFRKPDRKKNIL